MNLIESELSEVEKLCEHKIPNSKLISCVRSMVRVVLRQTKFKTITVCIQFSTNYPQTPLLFELKSKTLSEKLLSGLTNVCEQELKNKWLPKPQILKLLGFVQNFLNENSLCCCYDEINNLRKLFTSDRDEMKLKQKSSNISFKIVNDLYYLKMKVVVPDDYPEKCVSLDGFETNFPPLFSRFMLAQAREYARQCVEPPLRKMKPQYKFEPKPSLEPAIASLIECVKCLPKQNCQFCKRQCFPDKPEDIVSDETSPKHVGRLYCGHLFHNECLIDFMRKPPFGNKRCGQCNQKIYHDKWALTDKLAEDRWSHEQARERELAEVSDFFQ